MAIRDIFKISRRTFFAPRSWLGYDSLKETNRTIGSILTDLFSYDVETKTETFAEATKRLKISEETLNEIHTTYRSYAFLFCLIGALSFFYSFYLLFRYIAIIDWVLGMAVTTLFLTYAFQYDFWSLQIRKRKLGLTFKDWKDDVLGAKDKKHD